MKTIETYWLKSLIGLVFFVSACDEREIVPNVSKESGIQPACNAFLLGDKDGFGVNLKPNQPFEFVAGTALPIDFRDAGESYFTDIYPADMGNSTFPIHEISYLHEFEKPLQKIASARLNFFTFGIQDGDTQVYGSETDIRLFLDNIEIPEAFDKVDQFGFVNGKWSSFASLVQIEVPQELLYQLLDGKIDVRWEILQLNPDCESFDGFAIDYSELELCFATGPAY